MVYTVVRQHTIDAGSNLPSAQGAPNIIYLSSKLLRGNNTSPEAFLGGSNLELPTKPRLANHVILEYDVTLRTEFQRLVDAKVAQDDPDLLNVVLAMLDPPQKSMVKMSRQLFETPQSKAAMELKNRWQISRMSRHPEIREWLNSRKTQ